MFKHRIFCFIFVFSLFLNPCLSFAYSSLYNIEGLNVSSKSSSSLQAKNNALREAKINAFRIMLGRLVLDSQKYKVKIPTEQELNKIIYSLSINDEVLSPSSYTGILDIKINPSAINSYLQEQEVNYVTVLPPTTLLTFKNINICDFINGQVYKNPDDESGFSFTFIDNSCSSYVCRDNLLKKYNVDSVIEIETVYKGGENYLFKINGNLLSKTFEKTISLDVCKTKLPVILQDIYKQTTLSNQNNKAFETFIMSSIYSINDLQNLTSNLKNIHGVKSLVEMALTYEKVQFRIEYDYGIDSLISALKNLGFIVKDKGNYLLIKR